MPLAKVSTRGRRFTGRVGSSLSKLVLLVLASGLVPSVSDAAEQNARLGIRPVNQESNFFDLTMTPGESRTLAVELRNFGTQAISARTFPADAYTIVNGGFGARLRSEPRSGTTLWMDLKEEVLQLDAQEGVTRSFAVVVPQDTAPGDYITSLVIENDIPLKGDGGSVSINQVQRQAIAVALSVPGPRSPALEFGGAKHSFVGQRSVVAVALENSGNAHLKPSGRLRISDASGETVFDEKVAMDSFYAKTKTFLEAPLEQPLEPGRYTATLNLEDKDKRLSERSSPLPFEVKGSPSAESAGSGGAAAGSERGLAPLLIAGGIVLVLLALLAGILLGRRQRRSEKA